MSVDLRGKVVVIAGGASGAGLALARRAIAAGATAHVVSRSAEKLSAAKKSLGDRAFTHRADVSSEDQVQRLAAALPHVDHLVTMAADLAFKPFLQLENAEIQRVLGSKFWGPAYLVRHLAPKLAETGSITFVGGAAAYKASPGGSVVAAANASLDGFSRTLAVELAPIRVNVISPGVFDGSTWDFLDAASRSEALRNMGQGLPTGRVGTVDEIADAGMFLIGNGFTTGTVLHIDGGLNA